MAIGFADHAIGRAGGLGMKVRLDILLPVVFALVAGYAHFNFIQNHFSSGAYMDAGWYSFLTYKSSILLPNPRQLIYPFGTTFYVSHIAPILFLLSVPSHFLPIDRIDNISLVFGLQSALLVLAAALCVLALRLRLRPIWLGTLAALTGVALYFSAQSLLATSFPHFEPFFAPLAILFFTAFATGRRIWAAVLFVMMLAIRQDIGFHLFGLILLLVVYERLVEKTRWDRLRRIALYGLVGFVYSATSVFAHRHFLLVGDLVSGPADLLRWTYIGDPPFAHLTGSFIAERLGRLLAHRMDLVLAVIATAALAYVYRRPQYLIGYAAFVPWTVLNVLAIRDSQGTLNLYYGFPFVLALVWPVIYEVVKTRCFVSDVPADQSGSIRHFGNGGAVTRRPQKYWFAFPPGRRLAAVLAVILICMGSMAAAPHTLWVIGRMTPIDAEKRTATRVLMDFLDHGWADNLGLKGHEGVAAVSPDKIGELNQRGRIRLEPGGRGIIFYASELFASRAMSYALASGFDKGLRLGKSDILFAFRGEDQERVREAIERVNAGRITVQERGILYSALRAGPAGRWVDDRLGSVPGQVNELVAYGPYIDLEPGHYRMSYRLKPRGCGESSRLRIRLGVTANLGKMLAPEHLTVGEVEDSGIDCLVRIEANFTVAAVELGRAIEFPIWNDDPAGFTIEDITLVQVR